MVLLGGITLLNVLLPIIALPINILCFIFIKKYRLFFLVLISLSLSAIAFCYTPEKTKDLYRHHLEVSNYIKYGWDYLIQDIKISFEPIACFIKFFVSKIGNYNFLQAIIAFIGYYEILYIIYDYSKMNNSSMKSVFFALCLGLSLGYISFISGLFFYFAAINFMFGVYLCNFKKTKYLHFLFYIIAPLVHISTLYLVIVLIVSKILKKRKRNEIAIFCFLTSFLFGSFINLLNYYFDNAFLDVIYKMYQAYYINGTQFEALHGGNTFFMSIYKIIMCLFILRYINKRDNALIIDSYNSFIICLSFSVLAILPFANVYIRYSYPIILICLPLFMKFFNNKIQKDSILLYGLIGVFLVEAYISQVKQIMFCNIINDCYRNLFNSLFFLN